jgi:hypothetical protein
LIRRKQTKEIFAIVICQLSITKIQFYARTKLINAIAPNNKYWILPLPVIPIPVLVVAPGGPPVVPDGPLAVPGGPLAVPGGPLTVPGGPLTVPGGPLTVPGGPLVVPGDPLGVVVS